MTNEEKKIFDKVEKLYFEISQQYQYSIATSLYWIVKNIDKVNEIIKEK